MKTLRYLGLLVCVLTILAFVSGCGGGGGGTDMTGGSDPMMPDPGPAEPTDAEQIADAKQMVADILSNAQTRASGANSAASALERDQDATADQRARARNHNTAAQAALADIVSANSAAQAATTLAAVRAAQADATTAQNTLNREASAISSIQTDVRMVTNAREQREMDEIAQTGGSSLIKHLRDNKKVSDAVLASLRGETAASSIVVGATTDAPTPGTNTGSATYPYHKGATPTQYPRPRNTDRGVLGVTVSVNGTDVPSTSQTDKISGSGRLPNGFDLKDDAGRFATVYTDITVAKQVRSKNTAGDDAEPDDTSTEGIDEKYTYVADTDYLLAGIWLDDTTAGAPVLRAFAFGNQPLASTYNFCTAADVTNTSTLTRNCGDTSNTNTIAGFVGENESEKATYTGGVNGAYFAGGRASHFKANVSLEANFVRGSGTDFEGSKISGEITSIVAGGNPITGSIDLKEQNLATLTNLSSPFEAGEAAGVIAGHAYTGAWKGQFFGMRASTPTRNTTGTVAEDNRTTTTTYTPDRPGSVAGSFYVNRETVAEGEASFIGAFGAHR